MSSRRPPASPASDLAQYARAEALLQLGEPLPVVLADACREAHTAAMVLQAVLAVSAAVNQLLADETLSPTLGWPMTRTLDRLLDNPDHRLLPDELAPLVCARLRATGIALSDLLPPTTPPPGEA